MEVTRKRALKWRMRASLEGVGKKKTGRAGGRTRKRIAKGSGKRRPGEPGEEPAKRPQRGPGKEGREPGMMG